MRSFIRNAVAVIAGIIFGGALNMGIIMISGSVIPPPEGADVTTMEGLQDAMHLFQPKHFLMPFIAHALGTLFGAIITAYFVTSDPKKWVLLIGFFFFLGGVSNVVILPSPVWFSVIDLGLAYIPMALLGASFAKRISQRSQ